MKIELGKTYTTRDGREVRIYAVDGAGMFPVHGARNGLDGWKLDMWGAEGQYAKAQHSLDLVEPPKVYTGWVNVYEEGFTAHASRGLADIEADTDRVACVQFIAKHGEGL